MSTFDNMSPDEKAVVQQEFENENTTRERRIELLTLLKEAADESEMGSPCPRCKHYPFFAPHDEALIEGHVYSNEGIAEFRISGYCEFCFDLVTQEPDENEGEKE